VPRKTKTPKPTKPRGKRGFSVKKRKTPEFVFLNLRMKHTRGGIVYGPGTNVKVPFDFEREFKYEEQCAVAADERFSSTRAAIVVRGNRVKQVPVESFGGGFAEEFDNPSHRTS
jgi:hypothetical protein